MNLPTHFFLYTEFLCAVAFILYVTCICNISHTKLDIMCVSLTWIRVVYGSCCGIRAAGVNNVSGAKLPARARTVVIIQEFMLH